ncbi:hypothetical protein ACWDU3_30770 [Streptomyces olivaceus]|uniref:hypothetical protein n=1 Tax=Streptomyces olivaceus TaxID=47716 RepID=UPI00368BDC1C
MSNRDGAGIPVKPVARTVSNRHAGPAVQLSALQEAAGNTAVTAAIRRGHAASRTSGMRGGASSPPSVQRASSTDQAAQAPQPTFTFDPGMGANPALYTNFADDYWVGSGNAPDGYFRIEQHCAYLATYWLTHGHGQSGLRFLDLPPADQRVASDTVRQWAAGDGSDMQSAYAQQRLGGHEVSKASLTADATSGELPPGTVIWFGNDVHAEAAVVTGKNQFLMYDPNTGAATTRDNKGFISYIASKTTFVVKVGQGADPKTCQCCAVM